MSVDGRRALTRALVRHARLVGGARKIRLKLPKQHYPMQIEAEYGRALAALVGPMIRHAFEPLVRELPALLRSSAAERRVDGRLDAGEGRKAKRLLAEAADRLTSSIDSGSIDSLAAKFAAKTSSYQRIQLGRQTEAALGVNVLSTDRGVTAVSSAFVDSNVALIKNLSAKVSGDVSSIVFRAIQDGKLHEDIAADLDSRFQFGAKRAKLIARDQVGKLYGQVNATRQKELGVEKFTWTTVGDDRVRDEHAERDGVVYTYDDPPEGELPGEPINCRCWADPVFDELADDDESDDDGD